MDNKKISLIIINEETKKNLSFRLSKISINIITIFLLFIGIAFIYTIIRTYQQKPYNEQLAELHIKHNNIISMIDLLKEHNLITDSLLNQFNLLSEYNNYYNISPVSKPVNGIITRGIIKDKNNPHNGIDIAAIFKSNVVATQRGLVVFSDNIEVLGNTVIIAHPNNYYSLYAHMHRRLVKNRTFVEKNEIIGSVGQSETEGGPHLHFEIWHNNLIIDPRNLIEEYKIKDVSIR